MVLNIPGRHSITFSSSHKIIEVFSLSFGERHSRMHLRTADLAALDYISFWMHYYVQIDQSDLVLF